MVSYYRCIYEDRSNHRFSILLDGSGKMHFCYWKEYQEAGLTELSADTVYRCQVAEHNAPANRSLCLEGIEPQTQSTHCTDYQIIDNRRLSQNQTSDLLQQSNAQSLLFVDCSFDEVNLDQLACDRDVAFMDCTFGDNFRLVGFKFAQSVWFGNCVFKKHFSLKRAECQDSVHLLSCDFRGEGGVSLRALKASNIYFDLGCTGPRDMVWMNEIDVPGQVIIGGDFSSEIQIKKSQDDDPESVQMKCIGSLVIGKEIYRNETSNQTSLASRLLINGYQINTMDLSGSSLSSLEVVDSTLDQLLAEDCFFSLDVILRQTRFDSICCITRCSIDRVFMVDGCDIRGDWSLKGTIVSNSTYIEDTTLSNNATLDLTRFITDRLYLDQPAILTRQARFAVFRPRTFALLKQTDDRKVLSEIYSNLKKWLHDSGKIDFEDMAFFHLRDVSANSWFSRFFLGRVFGWGVRLTNIGLSSLVVLLLFASYYALTSDLLTIKESVLLSLQGFTGAFFGTWPSELASLNGILFVIALESYVGVLFITTFVGAYVRKLLR